MNINENIRFLILFLMLSATVFILNWCLKILSKTTIHAQKFMLPSKLHSWVCRLFLCTLGLTETNILSILINMLFRRTSWFTYAICIHSEYLSLATSPQKPWYEISPFIIWNLAFSLEKTFIAFLCYFSNRTHRFFHVRWWFRVGLPHDQTLKRCSSLSRFFWTDT